MRGNAFAIAAVMAALAGPAQAGAPEDDATPVRSCSTLPPTAVVNGLAEADAKTICRSMALLDGMRVKDVRAFEVAFIILRREGLDGDAADITKQLVTIVRLRGLYNQPDRWSPTLNQIVTTYQAFNGVVAPQDVIDFLRAAGPAGKALSDDGFVKMLIVIKEMKQRSDDRKWARSGQTRDRDLAVGDVVVDLA